MRHGGHLHIPRAESPGSAAVARRIADFAQRGDSESEGSRLGRSDPRWRWLDSGEVALEAGPAYDREGDLVFANELGHELGQRAVNHVLERRLKKAELPDLSLYGLRHTHATLLLANGVHPKVAAERLGHATIAIPDGR